MRIGIITDAGVGGHFLSWSLYYLSGSTQYWSDYLNDYKKIEENPLGENNCHGHHATHPTNKKELLSALQTEPDDLYIVFVQLVDLQGDNDRSFTTDALDLINKSCDKVIVVTMKQQDGLYHCNQDRRTKSRNGTHQERALSGGNRHIYSQLNTVWDRREFLALTLDPKQIDCVQDYSSLDFDHYRLSTNDLWHAFDSSIDNVLEFCGLTADSSRRLNWHTVYQKWRTFHVQQLKFTWYFDIIVHNIVNGIDMDLERFNLDIVQESAIQHELLYRHNLNLKNWQLEKFSNTQQLHNLLETNTHKLKA